MDYTSDFISNIKLAFMLFKNATLLHTILFSSLILCALQIVCLPLFAQQKELPAVGLMSTLTGETAVFGRECQIGFEAAQMFYRQESQSNQTPLRFVVSDTRGQASHAVSEFQRLISTEKTVAIISQRSQSTMPLNPLSRRTRIPLLGIVGQSGFITQNSRAFRFWPVARDEAAALAQVFVHRKSKRVAIATVEDEYAISLRDDLLRELKALGIEVVLNAVVNASEFDFSSFVASIKRAGADTVVSNLATQQNGLFIRRLRELGSTIYAVGNFWTSVNDFIVSAGEAAEEVTIAVLDPQGAQFRRLLSKIDSNAKPSAVNYSCFSALTALLQASASVTEDLTADRVYTAMLALQTVKLPDETLKMQNREAVFQLKLKSYRNGRLVDFEQ